MPKTKFLPRSKWPQWLRDADTENAQVELCTCGCGRINWHGGDWLGGVWRGGNWYGGNWYGGYRYTVSPPK